MSQQQYFMSDEKDDVERRSGRRAHDMLQCEPTPHVSRYTLFLPVIIKVEG